ncbi:MAG: cell division protein ZapA [Bdellovibrionota bacterium]
MAKAEARRAGGDSKTVSVQVAGREYRLKTGGDETLALEAARMVNQEIERAAGAKGGGDSFVLAALNLAGEIVRLRQEALETEEESRAKLQDILARIDRVL